jgi:hypothetical protein
MNAERDRTRTLERYVAMCQVGGSKSFQEMLEVGGLRSPFDVDCLREVAEHLSAQLA